jgi:hypothetical protein
MLYGTRQSQNRPMSIFQYLLQADWPSMQKTVSFESLNSQSTERFIKTSLPLNCPSDKGIPFPYRTNVYSRQFARPPPRLPRLLFPTSMLPFSADGCGQRSANTGLLIPDGRRSASSSPVPETNDATLSGGHCRMRWNPRSIGRSVGRKLTRGSTLFTAYRLRRQRGRTRREMKPVLEYTGHQPAT